MGVLKRNSGPRVSSLWLTATVSVFWVVWYVRNHVIFKSKTIAMHSSLAEILFAIGERNIILIVEECLTTFQIC